MEIVVRIPVKPEDEHVADLIADAVAETLTWPGRDVYERRPLFPISREAVVTIEEELPPEIRRLAG